jgi:hypothetical protein
MGAPGKPATADGGTGSVSVVTPPYAFTGRTTSVTIAGSGTAWDSKTTVAFANPKVKVNTVTVASPTGLLVNLTVADDATPGAVDVTVTDGTSVAVYTGAFQLEDAITVTVMPDAGVPQGGLANLHVVMNDLTTPFDPNNTTASVSSLDVTPGEPSPSDYAFDLTVEADVLGVPGTFDLTVTSDTTTSFAPQSFKLAARTPTTLSATTSATGNINTELDTELYEFTPKSATQEFVQFTESSIAGELSGTVLPKSGKYADTLANFGIRFGEGITSTDPFYVVVGDSDSLFGPGPTPADTTLVAFESPCSAVGEENETSGSNDDSYMTAQPITTLPALVSGTLGYGSVMPPNDVDTYSFVVPDGMTSVHVATGGDPLDDTLLAILDSTGATLMTSDDFDYQEDLVFTVPSGGTYFVVVTASTSGNFENTDNTYQLFIAVN